MIRLKESMLHSTRNTESCKDSVGLEQFRCRQFTIDAGMFLTGRIRLGARIHAVLLWSGGSPDEAVVVKDRWDLISDCHM